MKTLIILFATLFAGSAFAQAGVTHFTAMVPNETAMAVCLTASPHPVGVDDVSETDGVPACQKALPKNVQGWTCDAEAKGFRACLESGASHLVRHPAHAVVAYRVTTPDGSYTVLLSRNEHLAGVTSDGTSISLDVVDGAVANIHGPLTVAMP